MVKKILTIFRSKFPYMDQAHHCTHGNDSQNLVNLKYPLLTIFRLMEFSKELHKIVIVFIYTAYSMRI